MAIRHPPRQVVLRVVQHRLRIRMFVPRRWAVRMHVRLTSRRRSRIRAPTPAQRPEAQPRYQRRHHSLIQRLSSGIEQPAGAACSADPVSNSRKLVRRRNRITSRRVLLRSGPNRSLTLLRNHGRSRVLRLNRGPGNRIGRDRQMEKARG